MVFEDNQPQKIAFFEHVKTSPELLRRRPEPENQFSNSVGGSSNRVTIIVLDMLNTTFSEQETAREQLMKFLSESLGATEPISLMAIDESGIKVIHDFTTEPAVLAEALKRVRSRPSLKESVEPDQAFTLGGPTHSVIEEANRLLTLDIATQVRQAYLRHGVRTTLEALRQIGAAFGGIPGRKSLIWATGGFPFVVDDLSSFGLRATDLLALYESTWSALNRADIAVYPLDVEELFNPGFVSPAYARAPFWRFRIGSSLTNMETFARMTGGKMCYRRSDVEKCFQEAVKDSSEYYLLGYYPASETPKSAWRKLSVHVRRPGLHVRARAGYFARGASDENFGREQDLELGLFSPLEYTVLPVTVRWTGSSDLSGKKKIGFQFVLPPAAVTIDEGDQNHLSLDFAAVAKTPVGRPIAHFSQNVEGKLRSETVAALKSRGLDYEGAMELPPGEYTVRFVVRDNLSGQMGTVSAPLKVM